MRKYIPLEVNTVPKPEFMIWENLDFVKVKLGFVDKFNRYRAFVAVNVVNIALTYGLCHLI